MSLVSCRFYLLKVNVTIAKITVCQNRSFWSEFITVVDTVFPITEIDRLLYTAIFHHKKW